MSAHASPLSADTDRLLIDLDRAIANREHYRAMRAGTDDSLKAELAATESIASRLELIEKIGRRYQDSQIDSAITYIEQGFREASGAGLRSKAIRFHAHLISLLPYRGDARKALQLIESADTSGILPEDLPSLHESATRTYLAAAALYPPSRQQDDLIERGRRELGIFTTYLRPGNSETQMINAFIHAMDRNTVLMLTNLDSIIANEKPDSPYLAMAYELKGLHCIWNKLEAEAYPYLIKAMTLQLQQGITTGLSADDLSKELINRGENKRGSAVIDIALDNARDSGSKIRYNHATQVSPILTDSMRRSSSQKDTWITLLAVISSILAGAAVWLALKLRIATRRISRLHKRIASAESEQAIYFARFLKLCAYYLERLEEFTRQTKRKINARQFDELYKMVSSSDMFDRQSDTFYEIFDSAFCHAYPTFVSDINRLLQPDKQVSAESPDTLTTELRILAFMRIGFDESSRIAKFLNLSVNTVYTYRNRMRSRALQRDTFETDIMMIGH